MTREVPPTRPSSSRNRRRVKVAGVRFGIVSMSTLSDSGLPGLRLGRLTVSAIQFVGGRDALRWTRQDNAAGARHSHESFAAQGHALAGTYEKSRRTIDAAGALDRHAGLRPLARSRAATARGGRVRHYHRPIALQAEPAAPAFHARDG